MDTTETTVTGRPGKNDGARNRTEREGEKTDGIGGDASPGEEDAMRVRGGHSANKSAQNTTCVRMIQVVVGHSRAVIRKRRKYLYLGGGGTPEKGWNRKKRIDWG